MWLLMGGHYSIPDSNVHGANMGPTWGCQDPGGAHVGPMNLTIWDGIWLDHGRAASRELIAMFENWCQLTFVSTKNCIVNINPRLIHQLVQLMTWTLLPIWRPTLKFNPDLLSTYPIWHTVVVLSLILCFQKIWYSKSLGITVLKWQL